MFSTAQIFLGNCKASNSCGTLVCFEGWPKVWTRLHWRYWQAFFSRKDWEAIFSLLCFFLCLSFFPRGQDFDGICSKNKKSYCKLVTLLQYGQNNKSLSVNFTANTKIGKLFLWGAFIQKVELEWERRHPVLSSRRQKKKAPFVSYPVRKMLFLLSPGAVRVP